LRDVRERHVRTHAKSNRLPIHEWKLLEQAAHLADGHATADGLKRIRLGALLIGFERSRWRDPAPSPQVVAHGIRRHGKEPRSELMVCPVASLAEKTDENVLHEVLGLMAAGCEVFDVRSNGR
jgi:hypothetical protein